MFSKPQHSRWSPGPKRDPELPPLLQFRSFTGIFRSPLQCTYYETTMGRVKLGSSLVFGPAPGHHQYRDMLQSKFD